MIKLDLQKSIVRTTTGLPDDLERQQKELEKRDEKWKLLSRIVLTLADFAYYFAIMTAQFGLFVDNCD